MEERSNNISKERLSNLQLQVQSLRPNAFLANLKFHFLPNLLADELLATSNNPYSKIKDVGFELESYLNLSTAESGMFARSFALTARKAHILDLAHHIVILNKFQSELVGRLHLPLESLLRAGDRIAQIPLIYSSYPIESRGVLYMRLKAIQDSGKVIGISFTEPNFTPEAALILFNTRSREIKRLRKT
jgi:hypothetical protein